MAVAPADREPRNEVMEDKIVQHDQTRPFPQRFDDPAVRIRVVADVVEREVRPARRALAPAADDLDVDSLLERRQEEGAVVGDPRPLRRHRRVVRDPHASSLSMQPSQVTRAARSRPACPYVRASYNTAIGKDTRQIDLAYATTLYLGVRLNFRLDGAAGAPPISAE